MSLNYGRKGVEPVSEVLKATFIDEEEDTQKGKFLTFVIGQEEYGIEIRHREKR